MTEIDSPYYVFDDHLNADDQFSPRPKEVILLATLEIIINDGRGTHMLVVAPRYEEIESAARAFSGESAQWTPPYVSISVARQRTHAWRSVRLIKEAIDQELKEWNPKLQLERLVRTWSAGIGDVTYKGAFTEYKHSWGSPNVRNIYHVMRYGARTEDSDLRALADPECRKGFYYLPLDDGPFEAVVSRRSCAHHAREESMFLGRPLASNLAHIVEPSKSRRTLRTSAQPVPLGDFQGAYRGVLVCGDVAGYGAACSYIARNMRSLTDDSDDRALVLRESVTAAFMALFQEAGIYQTHTAGDGFIAAIPAPDLDQRHDALLRFFDAYARFIDVIDVFAARIREHAVANGHVRDSQPRVGSRLALHWGDYRYGKIAGAASVAAAFDGSAIIDVARFEQGLSGLAKSGLRGESSDIDTSGHRHLVVASDEIVHAIEAVEDRQPLELLGKTSVNSKEFTRVATVFGWHSRD